MSKPITLSDLPQFEQGYFTAAFFTTDEAPGLGGRDYRDTGRAPELFARIHPDNLAKQLEDCVKFQLVNAGDIAAVLAQGGDAFDIGSNFHYTRNHHGCGFWDGAYDRFVCGEAPGTVAERLTTSAHAFGEIYVSLDEPTVYFE